MTISPNAQPVPVRVSNPALTRIFVVLAVAAAGMAVLLALLPAAGHDQIWFLLMARRWLGGAPLYGPEIFDSNPPGIVWLSSVAVLVGKVLHVPATTAGKLLVTLAETVVSWLSLLLLRRAWRLERRHELFALLFASIALFGVVPARDFGQRDHMAAFLLLPYVLAASVPWPATRIIWQRFLAGTLAGIAICLKPHHALVPLAVETALLIAPVSVSRVRHFFRPEPVLIAAAGIAFLACIHFWTPLYFSSALPITRLTYWAIGHLSFAELMWEAIELLVLGATTTALFAFWKPRLPVVRLLLIAACAATEAYVIQGTGWYYQQLPAISLFGAALAVEVLDRFDDRHYAPHGWVFPAVTALSLLALLLTIHFMNYPFTLDRAFAIAEPDPAFFSSLPAGTPVAILTTSVDEAMMPVERYHLTWAQRTNNLWTLPAILRDENAGAGKPPRRMLPPKQLAGLDALQHRWMVEDLRRWQPQLVLVERCQQQGIACQELEDRHDHLLAWFLRDPAFATVWKNYRFAGSRGRFDAYNLVQPF